MWRIQFAARISRSVCSRTFVQNGIRLGLLSSAVRIGLFGRPQPVRYYAQPPNKGGGGFPGLSLGPQFQKGEALKEYVSDCIVCLCGLLIVGYVERGLDRDGQEWQA